VIQSSSGVFGTIPQGRFKTISSSVAISNNGDAPVKVEARFISGTETGLGMVSGANLVPGHYFQMGPSGGSLVALSDDSTDVEVATIPAGTTGNLDAKLSIPAMQPPGEYAGTVILIFSNP